MVLFQRKIIYMGYVPPSARTEEIGQVITPSKHIDCEEVQLKGERNTTLHGLLIQRKINAPKARTVKSVIVYLQGNAGNPIGRIPIFERLLLGTSLSGRQPQTDSLHDAAVLAVAPRSYWKSSSRRPTEKRIISDYTSAISYAAHRFPSASIILYGHSLGGAAAVCLSAQAKAEAFPTVRGLILENPFASIPGMVEALYPQKWLPYHYLGRFALDRWDALSAMRHIPPGSLLQRLVSKTTVILSEKDEIVPNAMGLALYKASTASLSAPSTQEQETCGRRRLVIIDGALHEDAWQRRKWRTAMCEYIAAVDASEAGAAQAASRE
ncbi:hypothetical protein EIP86_007862 [Pleurotus ostreatoroseus]|nr:hypothetical protein EIP86_007862 [Pleurotus ostreatoroseus]